MSAATKAAVDAAIEAHIADEGDGHFMAAYCLIIAGNHIDRPNRTLYYKEFSEGLPYDRSLGLAHYLLMAVEADGVDDDDD
jgi:hypothetical protein